MLGIAVSIGLIAAPVGYFEARGTERRTGHAPWRVSAFGWAVIAACSIVIGAILLVFARRDSERRAAAGLPPTPPAPRTTALALGLCLIGSLSQAANAVATINAADTAPAATTPSAALGGTPVIPVTHIPTLPGSTPPVSPSSAPAPVVRFSTPKRLAGRGLVTDPTLLRIAQKAKKQLTSSNVKGVVAFYGHPDASSPIGYSGLINVEASEPLSALDRAQDVLDGVAEGFDGAATKAVEVSNGGRPGDVKCSPITTKKLGRLTGCAWVDMDSEGWVIALTPGIDVSGIVNQVRLGLVH